MKISGVDIRPGNIIEYEGGLWKAVKTQHTQPGKGGAYMQVELKNIRDGRKNNIRFRSAETVEKIRLDSRAYQYLFDEGSSYSFMDKENFEQISISHDMLGQEKEFLQDGMDVSIEFYEESPVSVQLPSQVTMQVAESDPVVKGQTAAASFKPAVLENGARIMVPPFIESGEQVVVSVYDREYVRRAD